MTGAELLSFLRVDILRDFAVPYLWSDALILRYLTEAQEVHARRAYSIVDDTQTITTAIGTATYPLPDGTLHVLSSREATTAYDMTSYTRKALPSHLLTSTGKPSIYTLDEATGVIRLYPVPDVVYTINLRIVRLPSSAIVTYAAPEIPVRYHADLADYAAWRCFQNNDADGENEKPAMRHRADWELRLADAKRELYRLQLGAHPNAVHSWTGKRN